MLGFRYTDRPATLPPAVYCDTSFLLDLFVAMRPTNPSVTGHVPRARDAHAFYVWARGRGVLFVASILAVEEVYGLVLMSEIKREVKTRALPGWKDLRTKDAAVFQAALVRGRAALQGFHSFFRGLGLTAVFGGRRLIRDDSLPAKRIAKYARALLMGFELESMDAFHIALMRYCGLEWAASGDADWAAIPTISVIAPN